MRRHLLIPAAALAILLVSESAEAQWIFHPSTYSHDPASGQRVVQYAKAETPYFRVDPSYQQSMYRHNQSTLRAGNSVDHMHLVETWGEGENIRPYGEWLRPFREGATPYGPWGNPQGPWTDPFGSWVNPYGLNRLPYAPWPYYGNPSPYPPPGATRSPARGGERTTDE